MAERPILKLPAPVEWLPRKLTGGAPNISRPPKPRQIDRLNPTFARLENTLRREPGLALQEDPNAIAPEHAIVFEVMGPLEDFYEQAQSIGLEYLGDYEEDFEPSADFYDVKHRDRSIGGRIYLAMPDVRALRELLSLWTLYCTQRRMPRGKGEWGKLFRLLADLRPWGPQDRVEPDALAIWNEEIARSPLEPLRLEVELWFHEHQDKRETAFSGLEREVRLLGGDVIQHSVISEIRYDAALIDIPAEHARQFVANPTIGLARFGEIMFLRPQSVLRDIPANITENLTESEIRDTTPPTGQPIVALFDGLPVQNHTRLAGRLEVDDPDALDQVYPVAEREHGTEMASLIIHGDLNQQEPALKRPLHVRPILRPTANGERTPNNHLVTDLVYQAVRRLKEGSADVAPTGPNVFAVNFSVADELRPFARIISPLGRLLDYLSYKYNIIFLISAGNILERITVGDFQTSAEFEGATAEEREKAILAGINARRSARTLLSPAESLNGITVGASNSSSVFNGNLPAGQFDPFTDDKLPNISSAMGLGFRRAIKPDILLPGGRTPVRIAASGGGIEIQPQRLGAHRFGLKTACPHPQGLLTHEDFAWGTSVATALATRKIHLIHDALLDAEGGSNHADIDPLYLPVATKALLVHGARWSEHAETFDNSWAPQGLGSYHARRDNITRLLGYGHCEVDRILDSTENQATLLGYGLIEPEKGLAYRLPLPSGLEGQTVVRSITSTLAWLSPVNTRHQGYRMAALDLSATHEDKWWITPERECQPSDRAVMRGTVFHEHRMGEEAKVFVDDGFLNIRITCRSAAGVLTVPIPYALAISFQIGIEAGISVYEDIRAKVQPRVRA